jgi:hypothetical protein
VAVPLLCGREIAWLGMLKETCVLNILRFYLLRLAYNYGIVCAYTIR